MFNLVEYELNEIELSNTFLSALLKLESQICLTKYCFLPSTSSFLQKTTLIKPKFTRDAIALNFVWLCSVLFFIDHHMKTYQISLKHTNSSHSRVLRRVIGKTGRISRLYLAPHYPRLRKNILFWSIFEICTYVNIFLVGSVIQGLYVLSTIPNCTLEP